MNKLTMGSLFDGIGGFVYAGNQVDIKTLWSSEIDPACEAVTKHHFPEVEQLGDITKIDGAKVDPVDIICGGSPCQDLSVAGKRAGLAGDRSGLYMEQIRIIREMRAATNNTYPRYMVWENVPGALSSNKGEDFRAVLEEAARCADKTVSIPESKKWSNAGCIVGDGWSIAWRILDAQFWGVPQRRRRIFLVADFGSERAGEILFKQEGLRGDSTESGETGERITADVEGGVGGSSRVECLNPHDSQSQRIYDANGVYPCLSSNETGGQNRQAVLVIQGDIARGAHFGQNGKGYSGEDTSYTLNTIDVPAVAYGVDCRNATLDAEKTHTIQAHSAGGISLNCTPSVCYASTGYGKFIEGCPTLRASGGDCGGGSEAIIQHLASGANATGTLMSCHAQKQWIGNQEAFSGNYHIVASGKNRKYIIRRLTPLECDRLQGYPDNWTQVTYKNKPMSDSARYRMCGNSVAIPCVVRVLGGIVECAN